jgi:hypothetical protein
VFEIAPPVVDRQLALQILHWIGLPANHVTQPERFFKHLLQASHNRVLGFIGNPHGQFGLFSKKFFETVKLRATAS